MSWWGRRKVELSSESDDRARAAVDDLVLSELEREKADNAARQANAITRVSIVIAANAIVVLPIFSGGLDLSAMTGLQWLIPLAPAVASAAVGFASIHLWRSESFVLTAPLASVWRAGTPSQVRDRIIVDRLHELVKARADLDRKNLLYNWAAGLLLATLATEVAVFILSWCGVVNG